MTGPDDDELSEAEREYREVVRRRQEWWEGHDARRERWRSAARDVFRESLPNVIGTVLGAGVVYLVAVLAGLLEGARVADIGAVLGLVLGAAGAVFSYTQVPPGPPPEVVRAMELDALRAENARLRERGP